MNDLFIVDRQAVDEKYNFETLQHGDHNQVTEIVQVDFLPYPIHELLSNARSQAMELTACDELFAVKNILRYPAE